MLADVTSLTTQQNSNSTVPGELRSFFESVPQLNVDLTNKFTAILSQYGCWCNFMENSYDPSRYGNSQSDLDSYCKELHQGYKCAQMDSSGCIPWNVAYTTVLGLNVNSLMTFLDVDSLFQNWVMVPTYQVKVDDINAQCAASNTDDCARHA